jgi:two-component system, LytTR family, sensor kinase
MIKKIFYILLIFLKLENACGQQVIDSMHPYFNGALQSREINEDYDFFEISTPTKKPAKGKLYNDVVLSIFHSKNLYINTVFNKLSNVDNKDLLSFRIASDYAHISGTYKYTSAVPLFDSVPIIVTAYGINASNKDLYRFRVLKNKREEIIPWRPIKFFSPAFIHFRYNADGTEQTQMAYLGEFRQATGNSITIEIKNLKTPDTTYTVSAIWLKRAPEIIATFTPETIQQFIAVYKYRWKNDRYGAEGGSYYGDIDLAPVDSLLIKKQTFSHKENNLFFFLNDKIKKAELVEYNIVSGEDSTGWIANRFDANVIWLQDLKPGKYNLLLRYSFQRQTVNSFSFIIISAWYQTTWFKMLAGTLVSLSFLSIYLIIKNRLQKNKLKKQETRNQIAQAEIKSIKSQFNPHFVFNALSSIQGLITKKDIESAHIYLNDFSLLLRNSLKESENEFISLSKDIALVDKYLKLEQLRFSFHYQVTVEESINKDATEMPVLLLQPVIENAIKHGISGLYEKGILEIEYKTDGSDINVIVKDNGAGYNREKIAMGHGLKLTNDRIELINKLLKDQSIDWQINSTGNGTQVIFVFKNWLL